MQINVSKRIFYIPKYKIEKSYMISINRTFIIRMNGSSNPFLKMNISNPISISIFVDTKYLSNEENEMLVK